MIHEEGIETVIKRHELISEAMISSIEEIGLKMYPKSKEYISPTVTVVRTPPKTDGNKLIEHLWRKYGVLLAGAWGPELDSKVIRFGNMGYAANMHFASAALAAFEKTLKDFGVIKEIGKAVGTFMEKL